LNKKKGEGIERDIDPSNKNSINLDGKTVSFLIQILGV
jgi:hypothetical protein